MRWLVLAGAVGCGADAPCVKGTPVRAVLAKLSFARVVDGVSDGIDLDGAMDTCGQADAMSPAGTPGIDNTFGRLVPTLDAVGGQALEVYLNQGIVSGERLTVLALDGWTSGTVDVHLLAATGAPSLTTDGELAAWQTFDPDYAASHSHSLGVPVQDGVVEAGPLSLSVPVRLLNAELNTTLSDAVLRAEVHEDGRVTGVLAGGVPVSDITDLAAQDDEAFAQIIATTAGAFADLWPDETGVCRGLSVVLSFEAVPMWFYEDAAAPPADWPACFTP